MTSSLLFMAQVALIAPGLLAGNPDFPTTAKFVCLIVSKANLPNLIDCPDQEMATALAKLGMKHDPTSRIAWASTLDQLHEFSKLNKLVVCAHSEWLSVGAGVAIVQEAGRMNIGLNFSAINKTGIQLFPDVLKADPIPPKPIG